MDYDIIKNNELLNDQLSNIFNQKMIIYNYERDRSFLNFYFAWFVLF